MRRIVSRSFLLCYVSLSYSNCVSVRIGVGEVASSNLVAVSADQQEWITGKGEKFENRLLGPTIFSVLCYTFATLFRVSH